MLAHHPRIPLAMLKRVARLSLLSHFSLEPWDVMQLRRIRSWQGDNLPDRPPVLLHYESGKSLMGKPSFDERIVNLRLSEWPPLLILIVDENRNRIVVQIRREGI